MSNLSWCPRVVCYAERRDDSMIYFGPHDQYEIEGGVDLQQALLHMCNGHYTTKEIVETLSDHYSGAQIVQLLSVLCEQGIVANSKNCWRGYHVFGSNPMPFFAPPSDEQLRCLYCTQTYRGVIDCGGSNLLQLLRRRVSTRDFIQRALTHDEILHIACAGYGVTGAIDVMGKSIERRTVPSAGALYPLSVHVIIRMAQSSACRGIFIFDGIRLNLIEPSFQDHEWQSCFLDDAYVRAHSACFVISGDVERQTAKYADRGYRYTILEAGHVAQNMLLACTEMDNVGCVEVGGFFDERIGKFLSFSPSLIPITTVFVGLLA